MKLLAFDVETDGKKREYALQPWRARTGDAWLTAYAIAVRKGDEIVTTAELAPDVDTLRRLLTSCAASKTTLVGWNVAFDASWLIALGLREEVFACNWLDAMLLKKHVMVRPFYDTSKEISYALKPTVIEEYGDDYGGGIQFHNADPLERLRLLAYNRKDSAYTLRLAEKYLAELTDRQKRAALIEARCIPLVAETCVEGIAADREAAQALSDEMQRLANIAFVKLRMNSSAEITPEILASPKKLGKLLYDDWGLPVPHLTDSGAPSTDKTALTLLSADDERAKTVREYREANNGRNKFCGGVLKSLDYNGDGMVRPQPRIFSTYTSRLTYASKQGRGTIEEPFLQTGIALHQWKRDKAFREMLVAPEGYTIVEHDFAGQEFRWMAVESGDYQMLQLCQPGEDAHSFMGAKCTAEFDYDTLRAAVRAGDKNAEKIRYMGKVGNLSCQYRTSFGKLQMVALVQYELPLTLPEAKSIWGNYRTSYPGVPKYWKRQIEFAKRNGFVETQAGRRVQIGVYEEWDHDKDWSYESTALNAPIQGVGGDQKYLAMLLLRDYLPSVEGRLYWEMHDGIYSLVPDRYAEKAAHELKAILSKLPYEKAWGKTFPIEFPVDAKMGKTWGTLREVA